MEYTGTDLNYLHVCPRKLWLFRHGIRLEQGNDLVQLGVLLGEESFSRQEKEIAIGEAGVLDWADFKAGVIHETKHGKAPGGGDEVYPRKLFRIFVDISNTQAGMNRIILIGNGFDLAHDLPTSYKNFMRAYQMILQTSLLEGETDLADGLCSIKIDGSDNLKK